MIKAYLMMSKNSKVNYTLGYTTYNKFDNQVIVGDYSSELTISNIFGKQNLTFPLLIVLSGDSESGKSHISTSLKEKGLSLRFIVILEIILS